MGAARGSWRRWGFGLLLTLSVVAECSAQQPPPDLQWHGPERYAASADSFVLDEGQVEVRLRRPFIVELLSWSLDGRPLEDGADATLSRRRGRVLLSAPARAGQTLRIRYRYDPLGADPQAQLHDPVAPPIDPDIDEPTSLTPDAARKPREQTASGRLHISGSKTVTVDGGTRREATVDQNLQLSVNGELTEGIFVRAEISDEDLPVTPEGNTEELEDLDQVRIELYGRRGRALVGDFFHQSRPGAFLPYERKLQGVSLQGRAEKAGAHLLAGSPQGDRIELELRGREGVQGPYELLDGGRTDQSYIVAGSERVWLDGEPLRRGEDHDYIIDYVRGTIRFSERRPIGPENRIAVDFETSRSGYSRTVAGAGLDSLRVGQLRVGFNLLREADDPDRPTDGALSDADRDSLEQAGDDPGAAFGGGIVPTAPGEGRYVEVIGGGGERYFELADSTGGDFDVFFTRVDPGTGEYVLDRIAPDGVSEFRYVGAGLGDFVVGRPLALPEDLEIASASAILGHESAAFVSLSGDFTDRDANQLSDLDDEDNADTAWRARAQSPWLLGDTEGLRLRGSAEAIGGDFSTSGRLRAPFYYDRWNLQDKLREEREGVEELYLESRLGDRAAEFGVERLHRSGSFDGRRGVLRGGGTVWGAFRWQHDLAFLDATREQDRASNRRDRSVALWRQGLLIPSLRVFDERFRDSLPVREQGYRSEGYEAELRSGAATGLGGSLSFRREAADSLRSDGEEWIFARDTKHWRGRGQWSGEAQRFEAELSWRRSELPEDADATTRLGRIRYARRPLRSRWNFDVEYRASTDESRVLLREIVFVGIGQGDYDAEGNPVGVRQGDFNVIYTPSDSLRSATDVQLQGNLEFALDLPVVAGLNSKTFVQINERSSSDDVRRVLWLDPSIRMDEATTIFGEERLREDLDLFRQLQNVGLRLTYDRRELFDQRFGSGSDIRDNDRRIARLDLRFQERWSVQIEGGQELRTRGGSGVTEPELGAYDVRDRFAATTLRFRATAARRAALTGRFTRREARDRSLTQEVAEIVPELGGDFLFARWTWQGRVAHVQEQAPVGTVRPYFFEQPGTGRSTALSVQWAVGSAFTLGVRYSLRDEPRRQLRQDLSVETRARF